MVKLLVSSPTINGNRQFSTKCGALPTSIFKSDSDFMDIQKPREITFLRTCGDHITDKGAVHIGALTNLVYLDLSGSQISDAVLTSLANCQKLEYLSINDTNVTVIGMANLSAFKNLKVFRCAHTRVSSNGLRYLKEIRNLELLELDVVQLADDGISHLRPLVNLERLDLLSTAPPQRLLKDLEQILPIDCGIFSSTGNRLYSQVPITSDTF